MSKKLLFLVVPYRASKGELYPAEPRRAESEPHALELAELLAARFPSVIVAELILDEVTGDMDDPRILAVHGDVPEELAEAA